jgi:hypothetical protein
MIVFDQKSYTLKNKSVLDAFDKTEKRLKFQQQNWIVWIKITILIF